MTTKRYLIRVNAGFSAHDIRTQFYPAAVRPVPAIPKRFHKGTRGGTIVDSHTGRFFGLAHAERVALDMLAAVDAERARLGRKV
jgi:hypothetical protein